MANGGDVSVKYYRYVIVEYVGSGFLAVVLV